MTNYSPNKAGYSLRVPTCMMLIRLNVSVLLDGLGLKNTVRHHKHTSSA